MSTFPNSPRLLKGALVAIDHLQSLTQDQRVRVRRKPDDSSVAGREGASGAGAEAR